MGLLQDSGASFSEENVELATTLEAPRQGTRPTQKAFIARLHPHVEEMPSHQGLHGTLFSTRRFLSVPAIHAVNIVEDARVCRGGA